MHRKFSYFLCSCGSDKYSCLYRYPLSYSIDRKRSCGFDIKNKILRKIVKWENMISYNFWLRILSCFQNKTSLLSFYNFLFYYPSPYIYSNLIENCTVYPYYKIVTFLIQQNPISLYTFINHLKQENIYSTPGCTMLMVHPRLFSPNERMSKMNKWANE